MIPPIERRVEDLIDADIEKVPADSALGTTNFQQEEVEDAQLAALNIFTLPGKVRRGVRATNEAIKETQQAVPPAQTDPLKRLESPKAAAEPLTPVPESTAPEPAASTVSDQTKINVLTGNQPVRLEGNQLIIQPASPEALRMISEMIEVAPTTGRPPDVRPNLDRIQAPDDIKKAIFATTEYYKNWVETQRRAGRTMDEIAAEASQIGDARALQTLIQRKPGDRPLLDAETLAARMAAINMASATKAAVTKALKSENPADMIQAMRMVTLDGFIHAALLGDAAETGRSLAVNRLVVAPDRKRTLALQRLVEQAGVGQMSPDMLEAASQVEAMGGMANIKLALQGYDALPDAGTRGVYTKGLLRATLDSAAEIYGSALVSNLVTHGVNMVGTPIHASMILAERMVAALGRGDTDAMLGVMAQLRAIPKYWTQATAAGARAFRTESPADAVTKFDADRIATKAENFNVPPDTMLGMSIDLLGQGTRLLGYRMLTTADEFYKAMLRGMEMEGIAAEAQSKAFRLRLNEGASVEDAMKFSQDIYIKTLNADSTFLEAAEFARIGTFQDDLPGAALGKLQEFMSHPLQKLVGMPFFKTPMQIALRIQERTPLAMAMPRFWKAVAFPSDPKERSIALAKLGVSSGMGVMLMASQYISDDQFVITGYGPTKPDERRNWLEKNQPYAFGIKKPDGSYTWVDYGRYDPIAGVIASWIDGRDTILKMDDPEAEERLLLDLGLATMQYMTETHPAFETIASIARLAGPHYDRPEEERVQELVELLIKQAVDTSLVIGQSVATGGLAPQSMTGNFERYVNPYAKSKIPQDQYDYLDIPGFRTSLRPVYEAIQSARARIPYFSDEMFVATNDWFEPIEQSAGDLTVFLPVRIRNKKYNAINEELERLGGGFERISRSMGEPMIRLNDQQMNRYKELVNYPTRSAFATEMFLGKPFDKVSEAELKQMEKDTPSLLDTLIATINDPVYQMALITRTDPMTGEDYQEVGPAGKGDKLEKLKQARTQYLKFAKALMLAEFPELQQLIRQREQFKQSEGRLPRALPLNEKTLQRLNTQQYNAQ